MGRVQELFLSFCIDDADGRVPSHRGGEGKERKGEIVVVKNLNFCRTPEAKRRGGEGEKGEKKKGV